MMLPWMIESPNAAPRLMQVSKAVVVSDKTAYQSVVHLRAVFLNCTDTLMARQKYQEQQDPSYTLGMEITGDFLSPSKASQRVIAMGFAGGEAPHIFANCFIFKNISLVSFWWGAYLGYDPEQLNSILTEVLFRYHKGALRPHISNKLSFDVFLSGLDLRRNRHAADKIIVEMPQS